MLHCLAIQGSALCGYLSLKRGGVSYAISPSGSNSQSEGCVLVVRPYGLTLGSIPSLPQRQRKRQPSLSLNNADFSPWTLILLGGHRYWCSEVSGRPRKYEHKKCPESSLGRLSPPTELTALHCLAMAKVRKNPEPPKKFGKKFNKQAIISRK